MIDALYILCAQLTRDLFAIDEFLLILPIKQVTKQKITSDVRFA